MDLTKNERAVVYAALRLWGQVVLGGEVVGPNLIGESLRMAQDGGPRPVPRALNALAMKIRASESTEELHRRKIVEWGGDGGMLEAKKIRTIGDAVKACEGILDRPAILREYFDRCYFKDEKNQWYEVGVDPVLRRVSAEQVRAILDAEKDSQRSFYEEDETS